MQKCFIIRMQENTWIHSSTAFQSSPSVSCRLQTTAVKSAPVCGQLLKSVFSPEGDGLRSLHKQKALHPEMLLSHMTAANSDLIWVEREKKNHPRRSVCYEVISSLHFSLTR